MKECCECNKNLMVNFFRPETGDYCIFCFSKQSEIKLEAVKKHNFEEVEDKSCAGGACTL